MNHHFNRQGEPISLEEWSAHLEKDEYRQVLKTDLPNGRWVSTVWLGLDHGFGRSSRPLIFETLVFGVHGSTSGELAQERYSTEEEALAGHAALVRKWGELPS